MKKYSQLNKIKLFTLGINARTGKLLTKPVVLKKFSPQIQKRVIKPALPYIKNYFYESTKNFYLAPLFWRKSPLNNPSKAGWGIVINKKDRHILEILKPLIKRRKAKVFYYSDEPAYRFLEKIGGWDVKYPEIPYYILIVGSIQKVPLELQYLLDIRHSVGRIYFDNTSDYEIYVKKILSYKSSTKNRNLLFFAPVHSNSDPTFYSKKYLVQPLLNKLKSIANIKLLLNGKATEKNLYTYTQKTRYNIVFTATHGLAIPKKLKHKKHLQGSIVCQDAEFGKDLIKNNKGIITGKDIENGKCINCDILFMFGCYTAGTLRNSDFKFWVPAKIKSALKQYEAEQDFIAYLPQKLLASQDGPFVVIAHIDPAWVFSFMDEYQTQQRIEPFKNSLKRMLAGVTAGRSMRDFNLRYASLSVALLNYVIDHLEKKEKINPLSLSNIWVTRQDAQNYVILGDPAFALR